MCEMLDSETGKALTKEKAMKYAEEKGIPFVEGKEIVKHYREFREIKAKLFL
ncbi:MAG: hypothetical protein NZ872_01970 [Archaeoglobaceae archaeon]|nr:hypothetical protein [Archaeoglobaceae archaeon]MDW8127965.1 hypothetical protein [Archaeoglobaceae archaeon]